MKNKLTNIGFIFIGILIVSYIIPGFASLIIQYTPILYILGLLFLLILISILIIKGIQALDIYIDKNK